MNDEDDYCEASGRCLCIIKTEREEGTMPVLVFGPEYSRTDAESELQRRQELDEDDIGHLPDQCIVTTCKVSLVYWNGYGEEPRTKS